MQYHKNWWFLPSFRGEKQKITGATSEYNTSHLVTQYEKTQKRHGHGIN